QDGIGLLPAIMIVAGFGLGALFVRRQSTLSDPLIDVDLFRIPAFRVSLATYMLGVLVTFGYFLFIPQYLQLVLSLTPLQAGFWTIPSMVAFVIGSTLAPRIVHRVQPAVLMSASFAIAAGALALLALSSGPPGLGLLVTTGFVASLGLAPVFTLTTELIVGSAPPERAGAASGISETSAELGGALGIALLGSLGTAIYRNALAKGLPAGIPAEAAQIARDTLGGAVSVAARLPDQLGTALLDVARTAFVQGLHLTAGISAVIAIGAAIMTATLLRHVRPRSESEPRPEIILSGTASVKGD
ncbi:MAG: MFS transporter, partial [bacterium]